MKSDMVALAASIDNFYVHVAQMMEMHPGIHLKYFEVGSPHRDGRPGWYSETVQPIVWFGEPFLSIGGGGPWDVGERYIRLRATNGEWLWRLTEEWSVDSNADGPLRRRKAVWPD